MESHFSQSFADRYEFAPPRFRLVVVFFSMLVFMSRTLSANDPALENNPPVAAGQIPEMEVLPDADKLEFARAFEQAAKDEDSDAMNELIDWNQVVDLITAGPDDESLNKAREAFRGGFIKAQQSDPTAGVAAQIVQAVKMGGTFKFLSLCEVGKEPAVLFRLKLPNRGGANYHRYFLKRSDDGLVRAQDIYVFLSAERVSESARRVWLPLLADRSRTFLDRLTKPVDPMVVAANSLEKMQQFVRTEQYDKMMEIYRKLPANVQKQKVMLLLRLRATMHISEDEYGETIEDYRKEYPSDAALDFLLIDGYSLKKDFEKALECINRTNDNVGGDAWMISLRGVVLAQLGRFEEARDAVNDAIRREGDLEDAYWNAVAVSVMAKNHDDTAFNLTLIEEKLEKNIGDLTQVPFYADFVKTPQFAKWLESRK